MDLRIGVTAGGFMLAVEIRQAVHKVIEADVNSKRDAVDGQYRSATGAGLIDFRFVNQRLGAEHIGGAMRGQKGDMFRSARVLFDKSFVIHRSIEVIIVVP